MPVSASRVMREWLAAAARISATFSDGVAFAPPFTPPSQKAAAKACDSGVAERIVSVRPCLNAAVDADSYVAAEKPCIRLCASWKDICSMPSGDARCFLSSPEVKTSLSSTCAAQQ